MTKTQKQAYLDDFRQVLQFQADLYAKLTKDRCNHDWWLGLWCGVAAILGAESLGVFLGMVFAHYWR